MLIGRQQGHRRVACPRIMMHQVVRKKQHHRPLTLRNCHSFLEIRKAKHHLICGIMELNFFFIKDGIKTLTILQSIRRSLRGNVARFLMRLGTEASIEDILQRFDGVYGTVDDNANLLSQFYSASQNGVVDLRIC